MFFDSQARAGPDGGRPDHPGGRRWPALVALCAVAALLGGADIAAAGTLTLVPAEGTPGASVSLHGSGLPPGRRGHVVLRGTRLTGLSVDRRGVFAATIRIPSRAQTGPATLAVTVGARQLAAAFTVTKTTPSASSSLVALSEGEWARLSPAEARPGGLVWVDGHRFAPGTRVQARLGTARLRTLRADARGRFRRALRVPAQTSAAPHTIVLAFGHQRMSFRLTVVAPASGGDGSPPAPAPAPAPPAPPPSPSPPPDVLVDAVGDMACAPTDPNYNNGLGTATFCRQKYVSDLIVSSAPNALLDLGDNQYEHGELANYQAVYNPTFGRSNSVVWPVPGNAEYDTANAQGFFDYFNQAGVFARIGTSGADTSHLSNGYYSFDLGAWHVIALNSNCTVVSCSLGSPQEQWLQADLAAHGNACTLAYWHHPRFNSGALGNDNSTNPFWLDLYAAHADVVLNGHGNHHYERFVPQNPNEAPDANGIREFIVSTGGQSHGQPGTGTGFPQPTSVVQDYTSYGVLQLTLHATSYDWRFAPAAGSTFTDSGSATCH